MTSPTTAPPTSGETTESREPGAAVGVTREAMRTYRLLADRLRWIYEQRSIDLPLAGEVLRKLPEIISGLDALVASPAPDATVSAVDLANIIDPLAFQNAVGDASKTHRQAEALKKAMRIRSLYTSPQDVGRGGTAHSVVRDTNMFSRLANEPPAVIPEGYSAPLDIRTAAEIEHDRLAAKSATVSARDAVIEVPKAALDWLNGEAPDSDGKWFGECEPVENEKSKRHQAFWWRAKFRSMIPALAQGAKP